MTHILEPIKWMCGQTYQKRETSKLLGSRSLHKKTYIIISENHSWTRPFLRFLGLGWSWLRLFVCPTSRCFARYGSFTKADPRGGLCSTTWCWTNDQDFIVSSSDLSKDWGTLGKIRGITTNPLRFLLNLGGGFEIFFIFTKLEMIQLTSIFFKRVETTN